MRQPLRVGARRGWKGLPPIPKVSDPSGMRRISGITAWDGSHQLAQGGSSATNSLAHQATTSYHRSRRHVRAGHRRCPVNIIRRRRPRVQFSQIPNAILRDYRLSWRARGLLAELLSYPAGYLISVDELVKRARRVSGA